MSAIDEAKSLIEGGNLSGLVQRFKESGLDEQVSSWISKGENLPIAGDQIKKVLGNEVVAGIATKLGIPRMRQPTSSPRQCQRPSTSKRPAERSKRLARRP